MHFLLNSSISGSSASPVLEMQRTDWATAARTDHPESQSASSWRKNFSRSPQKNMLTQTSQDLFACSANTGTSSHFALFIDLNGFHEFRKPCSMYYNQSSTFVFSAEMKGKWLSATSCLKSRHISLESWGADDTREHQAGFTNSCSCDSRLLHDLLRPLLRLFSIILCKDSQCRCVACITGKISILVRKMDVLISPQGDH